MTYTPTYDNSIRVQKSLTLDVNGGTESDNLFALTGTVLIKRLWGVITEATAGGDCDGVYFDVYSAGGSTVLTKNDGVLDSLGVGSIFFKELVNTSTMSKIDNLSAPMFNDSATADVPQFMECIVGKDVGDLTYIRITHTSAGACDVDVTIFADYVPLSAGASLVAV
ncbi:MAG: hypothetical protein GY700_06360 [Propionibacteriaceae bacterium]|nr:hypothetical protein [Propionibacteriaceae bacterium]